MNFKFLFAGCCLILTALNLSAADPVNIDITRERDPSKVVPISLSGLSGEAAAVVRFDLEVCGFQIVAPEEAAYQVTGKNNGNVEGRLGVRNSRSFLFSKSYSGGTIRAQSHALANDIVQAVWGVPGVGNTRIVFKVDTGRNSEIYISDFDGFNPEQMTKDNSVVAAPVWVPGRKAIVYTSYRAGYPDIYYHDYSQGNRMPIARYPGLNTSPAVSRDGKVAMILSKSGSPDLYTCDLDGSNLKQLTTTKEDESSPCWSPDGRTICFVSRASGRASLYTIPASGGSMRRLSVSAGGTLTEPDWSPDGKQIIYTVMRGDFELAVIPSEGGEATTLVSGEDPSWAANSRTVIFNRRQRPGGPRILSLLDVPTKRVKDVKQISGSSSQPCWFK